jgi:hypothetical protein
MSTTEELLNYPFWFAPPTKKSISDDQAKVAAKILNNILTKLLFRWLFMALYFNGRVAFSSNGFTHLMLSYRDQI